MFDAVVARVPEGLSVLLAADQFDGTAVHIGWCQEPCRQYRIRLKGDRILPHGGGTSIPGDSAGAGRIAVHDARLGRHPTTTHIGILHEKGHQEPWIIALSEPPPQGRMLDDGLRWGIEPMCSDVTSRGFGLTQTRLRHADRFARLILAMALSWAVSTGMQPSPYH